MRTSALLVTSIIAFLFISTVPQSYGANVSARSLFEWLEQPEALEVIIETDLRALMSEKGNDYQTARVSFWDAMGQPQELLAEIKPRGKYRRKVCDFPPIKLRFDEEDLQKRGLAPFNTLKVVTHCISDQSESKDNLLREYLAYGVYQQLTPMSYRVKLAEITYVDSKNREKPFTRTAFFIEPTEELVYRLEGEEVEAYGTTFDQLEAQNALEVRVFQYFIGNGDWDLANLRNVKLVRHKETGDLFAIPYDFDFAGWVNPSYAVPNVNIGQTDVCDRFFAGQLPSVNMWEKCYSRLEYLRPGLESDIRSLEGLSPASKRELLRYLDSFFVRDSKQLARQIQVEVERA